MQQNYRDTLKTCLIQIFGRVEDSFVDEALPLLSWVELSGAERLFEEGEAEDGVYFVISGRLRATVMDGEREVSIGEIGRGETVGEMAVLTGESRSATVTAIRDSVLAHVPRDAFDVLWHRHPELTVHMAKIVIARLKRSSGRDRSHRPTTVCLLGVTPDVDATAFAENLVRELGRWGVSSMETSASVDARFGEGAAQNESDEEAYHRVALWLDDVEFWNEYVLLVADPEDTAWTRRCLRQSEEVMLLAHGDRSAEPSDIERSHLMGDGVLTGARQTLLLIHPASTVQPGDTTAWLDRRSVDMHYHLREDSAADVKRMARIITGNSIGLVLAGGGARGFAHLGVYKALHEAGVNVDFVGGASIGAAMGALLAYDLPPDEIIAQARSAFSKNPTSDFSPLLQLSLFKGRKLKRIIDQAVSEISGSADPDLTDCWRTFYCIATNYSKAREQVMLRGPLKRAIRSSVSIPVALPPLVWDGDLLMDGGVLNNFPTDVMSRWNVGRIIGVDLGRARTRSYEFEETPSPLSLFIDRLKPYAKQRYKLPRLGAVMMGTTILYSESRRAESAESVDLYLNPDLARVGLLEWKAFDRIVDIGYRCGKEMLEGMSEADLEPYRD
jgi:NTE family protein